MAFLPALIALLTAAPQLINGAEKIWQAIMTLHAAGGLTLTSDQLAAMQKMSFQLDADIAAMLAAKPVVNLHPTTAAPVA